MASNDGFRKYVEAGAALGQITRARAEEIVRELVGAGQLQGTQAQEWVDDLVERSRKASEDLLALVRTEIASQLTALGIDPEDLAKQAADLLRHSADVGRRATQHRGRSGQCGRPGGQEVSAGQAVERRQGGDRHEEGRDQEESHGQEEGRSREVAGQGRGR